MFLQSFLFFQTMKIELSQQTGIKMKLEYLLDVLIERIVELSDFLMYKHITLSEIVLFALALFRALWYVAFGVENANYSYFFRDWVSVFCLASGLHLVGFFFKQCSLRVAAAYIYTFVWAFLTVLAIYSGTRAAAAPTLGVFALYSFVMIVRLSRETAKKEC